MPSRTHYVIIPPMGGMRFDAAAKISLYDLIRRRSEEGLSSLYYERVASKLTKLPFNFRKAIPLLQEIAKEYKIPIPPIKKFRLPKHLRKNKNPIYCWKSQA